MSDLEVKAISGRVVHIVANSEPAVALLQMFCSPDLPTAGLDGRQFIVLVRDDLDDVVQRARLAGLTIEVRQLLKTHR
jgi:hypothetical protein